jgi:hypothetical protein
VRAVANLPPLRWCDILRAVPRLTYATVAHFHAGKKFSPRFEMPHMTINLATILATGLYNGLPVWNGSPQAVASL